MTDLKLDSTHDIEVIAGEVSHVTGLDAISQNLKQRLLHLYNEWFLNRTEGVPWFQQIHKKNPNPVVVDAILKRAIIETPGVVELLELVTDIDKTIRKLTVTFKVRTLEGEIYDTLELP